MISANFDSNPFESVALDKLFDAIGMDRALWTPQTGEDGVCRLKPEREGLLPNKATTTVLPLKKLLLPPREEVWNFRCGLFHPAQEPEVFAVIGIPLCDLQAVWYLDQVFADDLLYRARREQAFLVGMVCEPNPECRCDQELMPLAGDLFIGEDRVWALSTAGATLLRSCGRHAPQELPLPWPAGAAEKRHTLTQELYASTSDAAVWEEEAKRCLSCGACSAVCPTCYCFDMMDEAALGGSVIRSRVWDNCFFAEHGKVAGDYDFRPGRADRLRFRMEHKKIGFGSLRGQDSCVGCGRCRKACPVDIDLNVIAERLNAEATP